MVKANFNTIFRDHAKNSLSPKQKERDFVTAVYEHICKALGNNCIQIGSYPRFTASHPLHDLDVLYILGNMTAFLENPMDILSDLQKTLQSYFKENTDYKITFGLQTHSVTLSFIDEKGEEYFGIDVVPAYSSGKNEFDLDMYVVPEIVKMKRTKRQGYYSKKAMAHEAVGWVKTDPRGYIKIASNLNEQNDDYRKTVKFIKKWKHNASSNNQDIKLKSFHIEQIVVGIFLRTPEITMFDAIFEFFCNLPRYIEKPQIPDRADSSKYIDEYLDELTNEQRTLLLQARDYFLISLENYAHDSSVIELLSGKFYKRFSSTEAYLFDSFIPMLTDGISKLRIDGWLRKKNGFREGWLSEIDWKIEILRDIDFSIRSDNTAAELYKWKVKNHNSAPEPRGEITDHHTSRTPESTKYSGDHYVECYAIKNNVCVARHRIGVPIT